jgi:D-alanine-D-alanine ligase
MSSYRFKIALLYNEDSSATHGDPNEILAVQSTTTTAQHVHAALVELGYQTHRVAVHGSYEELADALAAFSPADTVIFNNCDGFGGSNQAAADVVRLIEEAGFKHTGASTAASELCIDKPRAKAALLARDIPTPRYQVFRQACDEFRLAFPVIVKPAVEDGSMGIALESVVTTPNQLCQQVERVLTLYEEPALVEEFIAGRELAAAMLGNENIEILPIAEEDYSQIPNPLEWLLTYEAKWDAASPYYNNILARVPADLTPAEAETVRAAAEGAFRAIGLRDFGRVDIRLQDGIPYIIDINELPDLAPDAGFWNSARAAGMTYPQMIDKIVKHALRREGWIP